MLTIMQIEQSLAFVILNSTCITEFYTIEKLISEIPMTRTLTISKELKAAQVRI